VDKKNMDQRVSISFTSPTQNHSQSGIFSATIYLGRFMIMTGLCETPIQFINKKLLEKGLEEAYEYARKMNNNNNGVDDIVKKMGIDDIEQMKLESNDLTEVMSTLNILSLKEPFGCIVSFKDNISSNCLLVVGTNKVFYVIDICNNIFYETTTPEYDVANYKYGSESFNVIYFSMKTEKPPPSPKTTPVLTRTSAASSSATKAPKKQKIKKEKEEK
jgi:hypothetical protein